MIRPPLTSRQQETLEAISSIHDASGFYPTYQELADHASVGKVTILQHVEQLERKGYISREKGRQRSIRLIPDKRDAKLLKLAVRLRCETRCSLETTMMEVADELEALAARGTK